MPLRGLALCLVTFLCFCPVNAKDASPVQVLVWPTSGAPVVRFSFGKFKEVGVADKHHNYETEVTAENLWTKRISSADFTLYLYDKNKIRIADAALTISDVAPGSQVKFQTYINASSPIVSLELIPKALPAELDAYLHLPPKQISITVNSVPQGAEFEPPRKSKFPRASMSYCSVRKDAVPARFRLRSHPTRFPAAASATNWELPLTIRSNFAMAQC
jgi:hypothetical protein